MKYASRRPRECSDLEKRRLVGLSARLEPTAWEAPDRKRRRDMELVARSVKLLD
jgi:hypothetical protein